MEEFGLYITKSEHKGILDIRMLVLIVTHIYIYKIKFTNVVYLLASLLWTVQNCVRI